MTVPDQNAHLDRRFGWLQQHGRPLNAGEVDRPIVNASLCIGNISLGNLGAADKQDFEFCLGKILVDQLVAEQTGQSVFQAN